MANEQNLVHAQTFGVLGAIVGDVVGSAYEGDPVASPSFDLFSDMSVFTDDTVCTLAVADAFMRVGRGGVMSGPHLAMWVMALCRQYPEAGYGARFHAWLEAGAREPYGSFGNGAAMRVSPSAAMSGDLSAVLGLFRVPVGVSGAPVAA